MSRKIGSKNKNKKEKPVKEKKQRGRPKGSIKHMSAPQARRLDQHQQQIVNVNIGRGVSSEQKERKRKQQLQQPTLIFNPSVSLPSFGYSNRDAVNPSFIPEIPQFNVNDILDRLQKETPPITTYTTVPPKPTEPIKTSPIKTSPILINPSNNVNPPIRYQPNPQSDQSHPIPPELLIDSSISIPIHNKHLQHKQNIQQITPQVPITKDIKKPIFKDTEGLGTQIPIQNIGALASTIVGGALTGGSIAAGEALITSGLTGLAGAGESIIGTSVGSGIGAGINSALGGGNVGNVVSGIIGGVAGRTAGRTVRNTRARVQEMAAEARARSGETQPLINGNRLGGSRTGQSRLVESEIQPASDAPGTWVIPEYEPNTIMRSIKKQAKKTMQAASDTYDNLRQQITGRVTNASHGRYSRVPSNEVHEPPIQQHIQQQREAPVHDITNEIMPNLHASASRIQRMTRAVKQRKVNAQSSYYEQISREFDENMARTRAQEQQHHQDAINELDQILRQDALNSTAANQSASATRIQNAFRGHKALDKVLNRAASREINKQAKRAVTNQAYNNVKQEYDANQLYDAGSRINSAARTIQSAVRNNNARKELKSQILNKLYTMDRQQRIKSMQNEIMAQGAVNDMVDNAVEHSAARTIQTATRGHLARNELGNRINAAEQFNPINYQDALRANKKTFQNQVLDYTYRRPQPITEKQSKKLNKAKNRIESINKLTEKRKQPGRPPGPSSRLSTAATLPPNSPGAAFTPHKK
jgi:hypothetical protein